LVHAKYGIPALIRLGIQARYKNSSNCKALNPGKDTESQHFSGFESSKYIESQNEACFESRERYRIPAL
jgi:hypothetical protein